MTIPAGWRNFHWVLVYVRGCESLQKQKENVKYNIYKYVFFFITVKVLVWALQIHLKANSSLNV